MEIKLEKKTQESESGERTPSELIAIAIKQNIDIEKLERLMSLQERYQANIARKKFLSAMAIFQSKCPKIEKKKQVSFGNTNYKYAELGEISDAIKESLLDAELSYRWEIDDAENGLKVTCIVSHIDGHSEKTAMSSEKDSSGNKNNIQARASAITYLQRYTLIGALGLTTANEDIDGRTDEDSETSKSGDATKKPQYKKDDDRPWLSENQFKKALERITNGETDVFKNACEQFKMKKIYREELQKAFDYASSLEKEPEVTNGQYVVIDSIKDAINKAATLQEIGDIYNRHSQLHNNNEFCKLITDKRKLISKS